MSAYVVHPLHVWQLALYATERQGNTNSFIRPSYAGIVTDTAPPAWAYLYAKTLWDANVRSVAHRYDLEVDEDPVNLPGYGVAFDGTPQPQPDLTLTPVDILKMADGYEYQANETDDWEGSPEQRLLNLIRSRAISDLPGYDRSPFWAYDGGPQT